MQLYEIHIVNNNNYYYLMHIEVHSHSMGIYFHEHIPQAAFKHVLSSHGQPYL